MENLYYNLSEQEFTRERKILLWVFSGLFFVTGLGIIFMNLFMHQDAIKLSLSIIPFGISILVGIIAAISSFGRKDHFFMVDDNKIEFHYGTVNPKKQSFLWNNINEICMPHKQKKVRIIMKDGTTYNINLTWIEKKKSSHIRKHIFYGAKEKNINITKVQTL